jgi:hypothetical protein
MCSFSGGGIIIIGRLLLFPLGPELLLAPMLEVNSWSLSCSWSELVVVVGARDRSIMTYLIFLGEILIYEMVLESFFFFFFVFGKTLLRLVFSWLLVGLSENLLNLKLYIFLQLVNCCGCFSKPLTMMMTQLEIL